MLLAILCPYCKSKLMLNYSKNLAANYSNKSLSEVMIKCLSYEDWCTVSDVIIKCKLKNKNP